MGTETEMIHLDANYLIRSADLASKEARHMRQWLIRGETLAASSIAWAEFLNGPVDQSEVRYATHLIQGRVVPFTRADAEMAANIFNASGRRRGSRPDCFIAATAICAGASFATENRRDFQPYVAAGLRLL
jgi:predicted nucleic acid-binding protein